MNQFTVIKTHGEPDDYRGPFEPVRAAVRQTTRISECHRCGETAIPDMVHLVDSDGMPLCPDCTRHVGVALRRGLQALNQIASSLTHPDMHPAEALVWELRAALAIARPEEQQLLQAAAQLLAGRKGIAS
jgi:hypothetical protein